MRDYELVNTDTGETGMVYFLVVFFIQNVKKYKKNLLYLDNF